MGNVDSPQWSICHDEVLVADGDLLEYHVGHRAQIVMQMQNPKVQISLDATIENIVPHFDVEEDAFEVLPFAPLQQSLQEGAGWKFDLIPEATALHRETYEALHRQNECSIGEIEKYELYIDGATSQSRSAWAVVVVQVSRHGRRFMGCVAGVTEINSCSGRWIGALDYTNIAAELTAMAVATSFAYFGSTEIPVTIRPDLALSNRYFSLQSTTRQQSTLTKVIHALGQAKPCGVDIEEIRAHQGDPWNELADAIAKHVVVTGTEVGQVPWHILNQIANSPSTVRWEWLRNIPVSYQQTMPALHGNAVWQPTSSIKQMHIQVEKPLIKPTSVCFSLKVATYNGLALNEETELELGPVSRNCRLDLQFHQSNLAMIGIQEARTSEGCRVSDNYRILSSGFQQCGRSKHFGCELWIHKTISFCTLPDGRKVGLKDCKVTVVANDARTLIVNFEGPIAFTVVVAHAPCVTAERSIQSVTEWWDGLSTTMRQINSGNIVVLIDANAPLADQENQFFGLHQAETINPQGVVFQEFLIANCLYAPATFSGHEGPGTTWKHPRGNLLRRDYVLLSKSFFSVCAKTLVMSEFDGGFSHADHCPAVCFLEGILMVGDQGHKIKWDLQKMQDPVAQKAFAEALCTLPIPSWLVSIDDHSAIVETNLLQLAQQHFGKTKNVKARPALKSATIDGIQLKRQMLAMLRHQEFHDPTLQDEIKTLEKYLRPMILEDQKAWYASWLDGINEDNARFDTAGVYKKLQRLGRRKKSLGKGPRPLPKLKIAENKFAQSFEDCQETWRKQFALVEAGIQISDAQLKQLHMQKGCTTRPDIRHCPDPCEILATVRKFKNGKVPGPGQLPVDLLKSGGIDMARILAPLFVKASWHMREPLTWKGGILVPLFKGKGSPAEPSAYRSIFLSDVCAKIHHAHVRRELADTWCRDQELIQMGGRKGCATDVAHHLLHAHLSWSRSRNVSCGILFVDLQAAFYSILRSSLFPGEFHDDTICFAMKQLGITPSDWHEIKECVTLDNATVGLDEHSEAVLKDMFSGTHFTMQGISGKTATTRGTRPGDPVADVLFNMAFKLVVLDARANIQDATGMQCFGSPKTVEDLTRHDPIPRRAFAEITFVDDIAYAIHSDSPGDVVSSLQSIASCLHDAATKRGLGINYQAGKTEAILKLAGSGSKAVKHKVWHESGGALPVVTENGAQMLRIVHSYKHLGSFVQDHAVVHKDAQHRVSQARKAFGQLSRPFYCKRNVHDCTKSSVFSSLVMSRMTYNVHTWSWITEHDVDRWENGLKAQVATMAKNKIRPCPPFMFSTVELCALIGLNSPSDVLHANRLRYAKRAIQTAPAVLWAFLHANSHCNSWMPQLIKSYDWLCQHLRPGVLPHCPTASDILQVIALDCRWNGHIRSALKSCLQFHQARAQGKLWTSRICSQVEGLASIGISNSECIVQKWKCNLCCETFGSKKALSVHARHKHQYRKMLKYFVLGDECLVCGKKFFSRVRLLAHVAQSEHCKESYLACFAPASEEEVQLLEQEEREQARALRAQGWHHTKAFLPVTRVHGPTLPESGTEDAALMKAKWLSRISVTGRAFEGLDGYCDQTPTQEAAEIEIVPFLFQSNGGRDPGEAGIFQQFGLAAETARLHVKGFLFIHFFSGYRRVGDLQHCIESHDIVGDKHIFCLSVDLCLAKEFSDLTDERSKQFWTEKMRSGQVLGVGGGPSCETWSAARHCSGGPPPVRSYDCPWGVSGLSVKQWKQVLTGTKLIQFLVELLVLASQLGLCGFLEHPQYPTWLLRQRPASIWTLRTLRVLARLECFQVCSFDQCVYGLCAKKPTTLLLLRMSTFRDITLTKGLSGRCPHVAGHLPLQGIQSDGSFTTARAKIYPAAMNRSIAVAVSRFLAERQLESSWTGLPFDLQQLISADFVDGDLVQPDFHHI